MGHSRHQALALIDLRVVQRAQPRGPLEGSLGCKYNSVFLWRKLDRHAGKGEVRVRRGTGETGKWSLSLSYCLLLAV